jgi:hypothetical protein
MACGVAVAVLGALVLGEYEFTGAMPYVAGLLFGLVVAEVIVGVGRHRSLVVGAVAAATAGGGLLRAAWTATGEGLRPLPVGVWPGIAIGAAAACWRASGLRRRPGDDA